VVIFSFGWAGEYITDLHKLRERQLANLAMALWHWYRKAGKCEGDVQPGSAWPVAGQGGSVAELGVALAGVVAAAVAVAVAAVAAVAAGGPLRRWRGVGCSVMQCDTVGFGWLLW